MATFDQREQMVQYQTNTSSRIQLTSKCDFCSHPAARHYATFDGKDTGCTEEMGQREGRCTCKGFGFIYRPQLRTLDMGPPV